jgi:hypothetical protein
MNGEQTVVAQQDDRHGEDHLQVVVLTTSGAFPKEGSDRVPSNQPIKVELQKAQKELEIADTTGWIVTVGGSEIDPSKSYLENGLKREVKLDWGPREGGGGSEVGRGA